mmetsp:Transcript_24057/g.50764  ORF Transcript_24057/g.50764 Transcript_24057/m.50764 type:complete len:90 (-) Transcript_24057:20-289(-)
MNRAYITRSQTGFFACASERDLGLFNVLKEDEGDDISTMVLFPVVSILFRSLCCVMLYSGFAVSFPYGVNHCDLYYCSYHAGDRGVGHE